MIPVVIAVLAALNLPNLDRAQVYCLALNIYHEARSEPRLGQISVANVTLNRVGKPGRPGTVCGVVFERNQFTWTSRPPPISNPQAWRTAVEIAALTYAGRIPDQTGGALHFYDFKRVRPHWATKFRATRTVRNHRFLTAKESHR